MGSLWWWCTAQTHTGHNNTNRTRHCGREAFIRRPTIGEDSARTKLGSAECGADTWLETASPSPCLGETRANSGEDLLPAPSHMMPRHFIPHCPKHPMFDRWTPVDWTARTAHKTCPIRLAEQQRYRRELPSGHCRQEGSGTSHPPAPGPLALSPPKPQPAIPKTVWHQASRGPAGGAKKNQPFPNPLLLCLANTTTGQRGKTYEASSSTFLLPPLHLNLQPPSSTSIPPFGGFLLRACGSRLSIPFGSVA